MATDENGNGVTTVKMMRRTASRIQLMKWNYGCRNADELINYALDKLEEKEGEGHGGKG